AKSAEASPAPEPRSAYTKVYADPLRPVPGAPEGASDPTTTPVAMPQPEGGTERNIVDTVRWTQQQLLAADDRVVILGEDSGARGGVFRATARLATWL